VFVQQWQNNKQQKIILSEKWNVKMKNETNNEK
jgi:hypothetical protein